MLKKMKTQLATVAENNFKGYLVLGALFISGAIVAMILSRNAVGEEEIKFFFTDFILNVTESGTDPVVTFGNVIKEYVQFAVVMFLCATSIVGAPVILIYILTKGFSYGTVMCCLFQAFGIKGLLIILCAVLPHLLFSVPCFLVYAFYCFKSACQSASVGNNMKKRLLLLLCYALTFLCAVSLSALIQSYIEPFFIQLISSQFV